jgi:hypothetical protein
VCKGKLFFPPKFKFSALIIVSIDIVNVGDACTVDKECADNLFCVNEICQGDAGLGEQCEITSWFFPPKDNCQIGLFCNITDDYDLENQICVPKAVGCVFLLPVTNN